ncbi:MAG: hypothetical protein M3Y17_03815 [Actinomycetota bacterium]|nr:hypothetical protein [Actinomycetota bacterium]
MTERFRRLYGATPLHLLALVASLLLAGAGVVGWLDSYTAPDEERILIWLLGAIVAHDLVLLPLYSLLDRIAFGARHAQRSGPAPDHTPGWVYVRAPALLSGLVFLVFFPEILRLGNPTFNVASGLHQNVYLARFLITCGVLFALAGLAYAVSLARARRVPGPAPRP